MRRREFIALGVGAAATWPLPSLAQGPPPLIVYLSSSGGDYSRKLVSDGFLAGMWQLGLQENRDYHFLARYAEGDISRVSVLAGELLAMKPSIALANISLTAQAFRSLTSSLPIVMAAGFDPVSANLVQSLARPAGNVTGITSVVPGQTAKMVELARDTFPTAKRLGALNDPRLGRAATYADELQQQAAASGFEISLSDVVDREGISSAIEHFVVSGIDALILTPGPYFTAEAAHIANLATASRLPTLHGYRQGAQAGCLISFGVSLRDNYLRAAYFVSRLLKGDSPSELPVELPPKLEMVLNLRTAVAIGASIPQVIQLRADEVIE